MIRGPGSNDKLGQDLRNDCNYRHYWTFFNFSRSPPFFSASRFFSVPVFLRCPGFSPVSRFFSCVSRFFSCGRAPAIRKAL